MLYSYLILNCLVGFLNTLGYLAALYAETLESYVTAIQLSYGGRVCYTVTLLLSTPLLGAGSLVQSLSILQFYSRN